MPIAHRLTVYTYAHPPLAVINCTTNKRYKDAETIHLPTTPKMSHPANTPHNDHSNPQRDMVANALVLLLKNLNPNLDTTHFAKHTPLKAEMKNSHDATTFINDCSQVRRVRHCSVRMNQEDGLLIRRRNSVLASLHPRREMKRNGRLQAARRRCMGTTRWERGLRLRLRILS